MFKLERATIFYGTTSQFKIDVLQDFAREFGTDSIDVNDDLETIGRKALAIICNLAGGHRLYDCKIRSRVYEDYASVYIRANGVSVFFVHESDAMDQREDESVEEWQERVIVNSVIVEKQLGSVICSQYGEGWKYAIWSEQQVPKNKYEF